MAIPLAAGACILIRKNIPKMIMSENRHIKNDCNKSSDNFLTSRLIDGSKKIIANKIIDGFPLSRHLSENVNPLFRKRLLL